MLSASQNNVVILHLGPTPSELLEWSLLVDVEKGSVSKIKDFIVKKMMKQASSFIYAFQQ